MDCETFLLSTKSLHFPHRGKVGQLSKRKRMLCWSIYVISLCLTPCLSSFVHADREASCWMLYWMSQVGRNQSIGCSAEYEYPAVSKG